MGDIHIPMRANQIPEKFRELLGSGKVTHVLCPGNVGSRETLEWVESIAQVKANTIITKGDFDEFPNLPDTKVFNIGSFKIGMTHGHQIVPWGDIEALSTMQRSLDVDILVSGHTHQLSIQQYDGRYFMNPGTLTGAFSGISSAPKPSFILLQVQGEDMTAYSYELVNEEVQINSLQISIKKWNRLLKLKFDTFN